MNQDEEAGALLICFFGDAKVLGGLLTETDSGPTG